MWLDRQWLEVEFSPVAFVPRETYCLLEPVPVAFLLTPLVLYAVRFSDPTQRLWRRLVTVLFALSDGKQ